MNTQSLKIEAVVAFDMLPPHSIGSGNKLPWRLKKDMARFKQITSGHAVLMGKKTALSIGRALPNRRNYVLTHHDAPYEGQVAVRSMQEVVNHEAARGEPVEIYVIGGEDVYRQMMPYLTGIHFTAVNARVENPDTFWPMETYTQCFPTATVIAEETIVDTDDTVTVYTHRHLPPMNGPPMLVVPK